MMIEIKIESELDEFNYKRFVCRLIQIDRQIDIHR